MSYLVFSHQAWAEVSGVKLQPEGRFMVLLSARDSKRLWSHGGNNLRAGKAVRRAAGQHLESPVPTRSPGAGGLGQGLEIEMPCGSWENSSIRTSALSAITYRLGWFSPMAKSTVAYFRGAKSFQPCIRWKAYHSCLGLRRS